MSTDFVPIHATIEISGTGAARAAGRLNLQDEALLRAAREAKRVDLYKDGLRLWRVDGGHLVVHEHQLAGGTHFRAVVIDALDDKTCVLEGWRPRAPAAYTRPRSRPLQRHRASARAA